MTMSAQNRMRSTPARNMGWTHRKRVERMRAVIPAAGRPRSAHIAEANRTSRAGGRDVLRYSLASLPGSGMAPSARSKSSLSGGPALPSTASSVMS